MRVERLTLKENEKFVAFQDSEKKWYKCSGPVWSFLEGKVPCNLEIASEKDGVVTKVDIDQQSTGQTDLLITDRVERLNKAVEVIIEIAGELQRELKKG